MQFTFEDDEFVARYPAETAANERRDAALPGAPALTDSLAHFETLPGLRQAMSGLPSECRCLIQGSTGQGNAAAVRQFLSRSGERRVDITAVDLLDLPAIYARLGWPMPEMQFLRADARELSAHFESGSFDLVIQDFLLNCAPPDQAPALLAAARQVLNPGGLFLLSVTDSSGLAAHPRISAQEFEALYGLAWNFQAPDLSTLAPEESRRVGVLKTLLGRVVSDEEAEVGTLLTAPLGRFEHFVPLSSTMAQLVQAGFKLLLSGQERGRDANGLQCLRWRCLAKAI